MHFAAGPFHSSRLLSFRAGTPVCFSKLGQTWPPSTVVCWRNIVTSCCCFFQLDTVFNTSSMNVISAIFYTVTVKRINKLATYIVTEMSQFHLCIYLFLAFTHQYYVCLNSICICCDLCKCQTWSEKTKLDQLHQLRHLRIFLNIGNALTMDKHLIQPNFKNTNYPFKPETSQMMLNPTKQHALSFLLNILFALCFTDVLHAEGREREITSWQLQNPTDCWRDT